MKIYQKKRIVHIQDKATAPLKRRKMVFSDFKSGIFSLT